MRKRTIRNRLVLLVLIAVFGTAEVVVSNPFYAKTQTKDGSFFAVRPFYSKTVTEDKETQDVLWPLYSRTSFLSEESSRALVFWFTQESMDEKKSFHRWRWLFPLYFQGRDTTGTNYFALFPLGGTLREFLGRDEITFALFPLFSKSRIDEVKTTSVLWPIYSRTRGDSIRRDRLFPICGTSVLDGKYKKKFVLWPFWTSADYSHPGNSGRTWILFPFCGQTEAEKERTLWLLPPFFRFTQATQENRLFCPWPFVQKIKSEWLDRFYLWPFWGRDRYQGGVSQRTFLFWPLFWSEKSEQPQSLLTHRMALPFFFSERSVHRGTDEFNATNTMDSIYWKIWPLMSWHRNDSTSRLRMLEFWPLKETKPIERNWAPLWTLYQRTKASGLTRTDALWFLWHSEHEVDAGRSEWSLLKGLLGHTKKRDCSQWRFLYFFRLENQSQ